MQSPREIDDVRLTFYCKDPGSSTGPDCAAFYRTNRDTWVVQGDLQGEDVQAQLVALKPTETCVEIPEPLVELLVHRYVEERYGIDLNGLDLGGAAGRTDRRRQQLHEAGAAGPLSD